uniref:Uncharacterized protein n=1 Tax=Glossina brevipalpis TaxID=37001 RepID=A0A1A9WXG9_9MUSC
MRSMHACARVKEIFNSKQSDQSVCTDKQTITRQSLEATAFVNSFNGKVKSLTKVISQRFMISSGASVASIILSSFPIRVYILLTYSNNMYYYNDQNIIQIVTH